MSAAAALADYRCAIYGRQSKDKKISIDDQLGEGEERAEQSGWDVVGVFSDGVSASRYSTKVRDDWTKLLALVGHKRVNLVWLWEASRGERRASQWLAFLELCQENGVVIYVEKDGRNGRMYDLEESADWKVLADAGVNAQAESDVIRERVMRRKDRGRRSGNLKANMGGRARYGWRDPGPKQPWELDPPAARVLAETARQLLAGRDLLAIYNEWTAAGPLYDSYGMVVDYKRLRNTLAMPVTAGLMTEDGAPMLDREGKPAAPTQEGPLDADTWHRLQAMFASRKRGRRPMDQYPLGRLLVCGECGNQLTGERHTANNMVYYACTGPHKDTGHERGCRKIFVSAPGVHHVVQVALQQWAENAPQARAVIGQPVDTTGKRATLLAERDLLQERMADLVDKRDRGRIALTRFRQAEAVLEADFQRVERELASIKLVAAEPIPVNVGWEDMTADQKRRAVEAVFVTPIVVWSVKVAGGSRAVENRLSLQYRDPTVAVPTEA